jgi:hypothetical protein
MQRNDAWPTGLESIPHLALLITDFHRPFVQMMLQRLQVPRQFPRRFLRATPHRGLSFGEVSHAIIDVIVDRPVGQSHPA